MHNIQSLCEKIENKNNLVHTLLEHGTKTLQILKKEGQFLLSDLRKNMTYRKYPVKLHFKDNGENEFEFSVAEKTLAFFMPNYIYDLRLNKEIFSSSYLQRKVAGENRFFSIIYIYYFARPSLFYKIQSDVGILIGRIFVNKDMDCFIEGKDEIGTLTLDDLKPVSNRLIRNLLISCISYIIDVDAPPASFNEIEVINVQDFLAVVEQSELSSSKPIGFQSHWDNRFK